RQHSTYVGTAATATIIDQTPQSGLFVNIQGGGSFTEVNDTATVTVSLTQMMGSDTTVNLAYGGASIGTAAPDADYMNSNSNSPVLIIPAGQTSVAITLTSFTDGASKFYEGNETLTVSIQAGTSSTYSIGSKSVATATIVDEYTKPAAFLSLANTPTAEVNEEGGQLLLRANLEYAAANATVNLTYGGGNAVYGKDYALGTLNVPIVNGSSSTFFVQGLTDKILELPNETFTLSIASVSGDASTGGSPSSMPITILDNDITGHPQVYLNQTGFSPASISESGTTSTTITLNLDRTVTTDTIVTLGFGGTAESFNALSNPDYIVSISTDGTNYTNQTFTASGVLTTTFAQGVTQKSIKITARNDNVFEPTAEPFTLAISGVTGGVSEMGKYAEAEAGIYTGTIAADAGGAGPQVSIIPASSTVAEEGAGNTAGLTLSLNQAAAYPITVTFNYDTTLTTPGLVSSPTFGTDFDLVANSPASVNPLAPNKFVAVIPEGVQNQPLIVQGMNDTVYEGKEVINLTLESATGGPGQPATITSVLSSQSAKITIIDDADMPTASIG
ncbi:MAG: hypothetical protein HC887_09595, partial [Desulfobacteraceae bacterium]|nr:hypothetical protein [Desulfobacteraceae bacterium]